MYGCQIIRKLDGRDLRGSWACPVATAQQYAHFFVRRDAVQMRPLEIYEWLDEFWFVQRRNGSLSDAQKCTKKHAPHMANVFERLWAYIFGCSSELCTISDPRSAAASARCAGLWGSTDVQPPGNCSDNCRLTGAQRWLVPGEISRHGCRNFHTPVPCVGRHLGPLELGPARAELGRSSASQAFPRG